MNSIFDFSDNQMNWRSCRNFNMDLVVINDENSGSDNEEDWFFNYPELNHQEEDINDDIDIDDECEEEILPPVVYFSGMDLNLKPFEKVAFNLNDYDCFDDFIAAVGKHLWISITDADNCDYELAQEVLSSEDVFDQLLDDYRRRL